VTEADIHRAVMLIRSAALAEPPVDAPPPELFDLLAQVLMDLHAIAEAHRAMLPPGASA
jgi:hypothetical protein